jgi:hypothetical protein
VPAVRFDAERLKAYRELLGFPESGTVPMIFPQAQITSLYLSLMTNPGFPLPVMGIVHVRNEIEQRRALHADEALDLTVRLAGQRVVRQGIEFDVVAEYAEPAGETVWRAVMTVLYRMKVKWDGTKPPPLQEVSGRLSQYATIAAPADTGRRYARISQDYNPIHLYALSAKLFGFPRAIAHGMWSAARCLALVQAQLPAEPTHYSVQFRQPLLLPGTATLRYAAENGAVDLALLGKEPGKVHLTATLR